MNLSQRADLYARYWFFTKYNFRDAWRTVTMVIEFVTRWPNPAWASIHQHFYQLLFIFINFKISNQLHVTYSN